MNHGRNWKLLTLLAALHLWLTATTTINAAVGIGDVTPTVTVLPADARVIASTGTVIKGTVSILSSNLAKSLVQWSGAVTNNPNNWIVWCDPAVTNKYFAENRGARVQLWSNDFSGLFQNVVNQLRDGGHISVQANPYYTNAYVFSNTVLITNWCIIEGEGNPSTVFRAAPNMAGPLIQIGDAAHFISGINRINRIRFEGDQGAASCVGVKVVNTAEPVFEFCEWTGFKLAGLQISTIDYIHWAFASHCWFVLKHATAHGILFDREPATTTQNHFTINDCIFGVVGAGDGMITVSNYFPNLRVINNHFRVLSGAVNYGFGAWAGKDFTLVNNEFMNFSAGYPIYLYDRLAATNYNSIVAFNKQENANVVAVLGDFVQGVSFYGNKQVGGIETVFLTGNNGPINNYDQFEMLVGHLTPSRAAFIDSSGRLTNVFSATPASSMVKADGSTVSFSNTVTAAFGATTITNELRFGFGGVMLTNWFSTNITLNFPSITAQSETNLQFSLTGASTADEAVVSPAFYTAGVLYAAQSSNGVVYVTAHNYSTAAKDPASGGFRVSIRGWR